MRRRTAAPDPFRVRCHHSERWLQLSPREQFDALGDDDLVHVDVMTLDEERAPYKLCELVVARGDLLRAIAAYGDPPPPRPRRVPPASDPAEAVG
ncbi:MAG: hypothetical protein FIB01_02530 [Gemmatimonadetes bacterium]|nr:hypothetical protein [Gemmatimonadota bacterium]